MWDHVTATGIWTPSRRRHKGWANTARGTQVLSLGGSEVASSWLPHPAPPGQWDAEVAVGSAPVALLLLAMLVMLQEVLLHSPGVEGVTGLAGPLLLDCEARVVLAQLRVPNTGPPSMPGSTGASKSRAGGTGW